MKGFSMSDNSIDINNKENIKSPTHETLNTDSADLMSLISSAEGDADVSAQITSMEHYHYKFVRKVALFISRIIVFLAGFITTRQSRYNMHIINSLKIIDNNFKQLDRINYEVQQLNNTVEGLRYGHIDTRSLIGKLTDDYPVIKNSIEELRQEHATTKNSIEGILNNHSKIENSIEELRQEYTTAKNSIEDILNNHSETKNSIEELRQKHITTKNSIEGILNNHSKIKDSIEELRQEHTTAKNSIEGILNNHSETKNSIEVEISKTHEELRDLNNQLSERVSIINEHARIIDNIKNNIIAQDRRLSIFLEEARKRLPNKFNKEQLKIFTDEEQHLLDALYVSFEDQFRGTREDIKKRARVYLPLIQKAKKENDINSILDLGCGRGEWLELLKEEKFVASGVDKNSILIKQCKEYGLDVIVSDVITYLRRLPDNSLNVVTGFHIIEHLPFDSFIKLLDETVRVLKPGGLAIFETPNPQNVIVGSYAFYMDPTHRNPLPAPMIKFTAESRGLYNVDILELHPFDESFHVTGSELAERFNKLFYGPQDYAVIGWKVQN